MTNLQKVGAMCLTANFIADIAIAQAVGGWSMLPTLFLAVVATAALACVMELAAV